MWEYYSSMSKRYPKLSLFEERHLISKAQKGSKKSKEELVLRHVSFVVFRIHKVAFPALIQRFGEDLLEEAILIIYKKSKATNLITAIRKASLIRLNLPLTFGNG